jgi:hypothetical protein
MAWAPSMIVKIPLFAAWAQISLTGRIVRRRKFHLCDFCLFKIPLVKR